MLVVGAGGLGCELLKGLALSYVYELHVIDLDTIDVSNLNRQFLFRLSDCGQPKAKVAAERVMARCPGVSVQWYNKPLQDFPAAWYRKFDVVIAGLSAVEAHTAQRPSAGSVALRSPSPSAALTDRLCCVLCCAVD